LEAVSVGEHLEVFPSIYVMWVVAGVLVVALPEQAQQPVLVGPLLVCQMNGRELHQQ